MRLSDAIKEMARRSKLSYKAWAELVGTVTYSVVSTPIDRNECKVSTLVRLANAAGYDVLLIRRHMLEYETPIVIDRAGRDERGDK